MGGGGVTQLNTTAYAADSSAGYYETEIKTPNLGNYQFEVEAHEKPSHETLPIISKEYFPKTIATFATEVDNTAPSAKYKSKPIVKVDVVFALGELSQTSALQNYIPKFTSDLETASNNIDARVEQVKTSTISTSDKDSAAIFKAWYDGLSNGSPSPYWRLVGTKLQIQYGDSLWDRFVDISPQGYQFSDGSISFYTQSNIDGVHEHQYGVGFRLSDPQMKSGYSFSVGRDPNDSRYGYVALWELTGSELPLSIIQNDGRRLAISSKIGIDTLRYAKFTVSCTGTNIRIMVNDQTAISVNHNGRQNGTYGIWGRHSENGIWFDNFSITIGEAKSLGEAISDVAWRDNAVRFVVHATDKIPADMKDTSSADYQYTVTKLYNSNAYLINLGTSVNRSVLDRLVEDITGTDGDIKGTFFYNSPISSAMDSSSSWIVNKVTGLAKPTDWILVNQEILWETDYNDNEHDLPLNFGKNSYDRTLAGKWGVTLTNYYSSDKVLAEKWRYSHNPVFYDNSTEIAAFSKNWIPDPITVFQNPGLYRVNYKRLDNPFYPDVNLSNAFGNYRYWSTDYDRRAGT